MEPGSEDIDSLDWALNSIPPWVDLRYESGRRQIEPGSEDIGSLYL